MSEIYRQAVQDYIDHFNAGDAETIAALYADEARVIDPVGTPPKAGRANILDFYHIAVKSGAKLVLQGPVRIAANYAVFAFQVRVGGQGIQDKDVEVDLPSGGMTIDVIDSFEFNDAGKIIEMRAFWGPENITKE